MIGLSNLSHGRGGLAANIPHHLKCQVMRDFLPYCLCYFSQLVGSISNLRDTG